MPNHIKNRLKIIASPMEIQRMKDQFGTHYERTISTAYDGSHIYRCKETNSVGWLNPETEMFTTRHTEEGCKGVPDGYELQYNEAWFRFPDFKKVMPCPDSILAVGQVSMDITDAAKKAVGAPLHSHPLIAALEADSLAKTKTHFDDPKKQEQFELACKAYQETGYVYWYDWNVAHWGTKWNAYSCEHEDGTNIFFFDTAWSAVPEMIEKISEAYPEAKIIYTWSDEDTGYNCGEMIIQAGMVIDRNIPEGGSTEAYDIAFELRPEYKKWYHKVNGKWEYNEDHDDGDD